MGAFEKWCNIFGQSPSQFHFISFFAWLCVCVWQHLHSNRWFSFLLSYYFYRSFHPPSWTPSISCTLRYVQCISGNRLILYTTIINERVAYVAVYTLFTDIYERRMVYCIFSFVDALSRQFTVLCCTSPHALSKWNMVGTLVGCVVVGWYILFVHLPIHAKYSNGVYFMILICGILFIFLAICAVDVCIYGFLSSYQFCRQQAAYKKLYQFSSSSIAIHTYLILLL